jgi:hypothetical protein
MNADEEFCVPAARHKPYLRSSLLIRVYLRSLPFSASLRLCVSAVQLYIMAKAGA